MKRFVTREIEHPELSSLVSNTDVHRIRFQVWLPFVFGLVSIALMAWGLDVERQCMSYDFGRPFWPCEAPASALRVLSAPPIITGSQLANTWRTAPSYFAYIVELPLIVCWWWFVGTRLDFGILGVGLYRRRRVWLSFFIASSALLLAIFGWSLWEDVQFYRAYPHFEGNAYVVLIRSLRLLPTRFWLLVLIFAFVLAALRVARGRTGRTDRKLASPGAIRLSGVALALYCACGAGAVWHSKLQEHQRQADYDLHRIMIKGRVLDDRRSPVYAIKVDLVPILSNGEIPEDPIPYDETASDFTDKNGEYLLSPGQAGRYVVAVQWNAPPSTSLPFLTRYHPNSADLKHAETLEITPAEHVTLKPTQLQRLGLVRVPVSVSWSDGTPEPNAYFLFMNVQYPEFGVIGGESLRPDSDGTVSLPIGFDYGATAQVDCDAGPKINSAYTPRLTFSLKPTDAQIQPLHLVLPGNPCRVWHPR